MPFQIDTMTCGGYVRGVTTIILGVDTVATVAVAPPSRRLDMTTSAQRHQSVAALTQTALHLHDRYTPFSLTKRKDQ